MTKPATLYHYPMACSLACVLATKELSIPLTIEHVDVYSKEVVSGGSLFDINPLGQVATLKLGDGSILTQNVAILHWIHTQAGAALSQYDTHRLISWLSFCATEIHKGFLAITMRSDTNDAQKSYAHEMLKPVLQFANDSLDDQQFLLGNIFSVADCYLFWALMLAPRANVALNIYPNIIRYQTHLAKRPAFTAILAKEQTDFVTMKARYPSTDFKKRP